jgi:hypothetical protein
MPKKRIVFLFGAGATMAWESPSTKDITNLIRKVGFKTKDSKTPITEFIFQKLLANGFGEQDVNFETIISVIEELIVYYSYFDGNKKLPSILSTFFNAKIEDEIFNYTIRGGKAEHGFQLDIPAGVEYPYSKYAYFNQTPHQFFLQHLLAEILSEISAKISKYAYHTAGHSVIDFDCKPSQLFIKWMKQLYERNILRLYTLNYERLFKVLLERNGMTVFEGFDTGEYIENGLHLRANIARILSDTESNVHYNLHGSAFWEVFDEDKEQLPNPEIALTGAPWLQMNDSPASFQVEKGKTILVTNIITGYQKAQKGMITPFKQMQAAFDKDCCFTDHLYIIGYSFGDEHLNESIKTAIRHNRNIKVSIVDPSFIKNEMDFQFAIRFFPFKEGANFTRQKVRDNQYSYFEGCFTVHTLGFVEFMETYALNPLAKYGL